MKEGWENKKLGEVCRIERGGSPRPIKDFITNSPDGLNWIKIGDTDPQGKYIYSTKEKIKPEGLRKSRWVEVDEFLLSNSMSFGRPYILKTNGCIHDGWLVLRDYQKSLIIDYFYYLLISPHVQNQFRTKAQGSTVSNLNTDRVADVNIAFPSLSEQQRIVDCLDSAFAKIDAMKTNAEKSLNEAKALFQASLKEMLEPKEGWEYIALSSVCKVQNGFAFNSKLFNDSNKGLPLIRIRDIKRGFSMTYTDETCSNDFFVEDGDLLIGMDGDFNIGEWKGGHALLNQRVCKLIPSEKVLAKFIFYFIPEALQRINDNTAFSTVKHLSSKQVNAISLPKLDLPEQQSIVATLDSLKSKVDRLQENYNKISQECDALKQAILRQVFD